MMKYQVTMKGAYDAHEVEMPIGTVIDLPDDGTIPANLVNKCRSVDEMDVPNVDPIDQALAVLAAADPAIVAEKTKVHHAAENVDATDKKATSK